MALKIYLLGQFKLVVNERQLELPSRPAQSLLAYLALNAGITQRRERLASLLWPDANESSARGYLRQALWHVRKALGSEPLNWEDYLQISNISITFDTRSDYWLDAQLLLGAVDDHPVEEMIEVVRFYRGELLPGFYDEWVVQERERLLAAYQQRMNILMEHLLEMEEWEQVLEWGEHWIRCGYSPEPAFRALMRAHAGMGNPGMVTATYQRCEQALERELAVEPSPETHRLYERISRGDTGRVREVPRISVDLGTGGPSFLDEVSEQGVEKPVFVARERELALLDENLENALAGHGRVVFITGEAGSGKTSLIQEFSERAQAAHADLVVASGNCNAYTGIGDPYLPFREILELLTGDIEARFVAGAMTNEHARRLWNLLPFSVHALVDVGPDLIDTFLHRTALLERASAYPVDVQDGLTRLDEYLEQVPDTPGMHPPQQNDLFKQYSRVLIALSHRKALLLVLDDLQWADIGSISLLFHLGRQLAGTRILILGTYRPEEISIGRSGERHPLEPVVNQIRRDYGDITVNLGQAGSWEFLEALLDIEPNRLGGSFRDMLYRQTRGHPLFTIELLRGLRERGDLVKDREGYWVEGAELDWDTLPARVEAVIAERIARLPDPLQEVLRVACVEGEVFTAEVVARVRAVSEPEMLGMLSSELDRRHRLVRAQSIQRIDGQLLSYYRFRHILFQRYLYSSMDEVERVHLHERVGITLEELNNTQEQAIAVAVQLAMHFQKARINEKATQYLHLAGVRALHLSAYREAIAHLDRGVGLLNTLPPSPKRDEQELELQLSLGNAWMHTATPVLELEKSYKRARELCLKMDKTTQLCQSLGGLAIYYLIRAEHLTALKFAGETLNLAQQIGDPVRIRMGHWQTGTALFFQGEFAKALEHLEQVLTLHDRDEHYQSRLDLYAADPGLSALAYTACCLWCLGYPDQALQRSREALNRAYKLDHPFTLADVLCFAGCLFNELRRDFEALINHAEELMRLSDAQNFSGWYGQGSRFRGEALILLGQFQDGIDQMHQGITANRSVNLCLDLVRSLHYLAEAQARTGELQPGMATLNEALELIEKTGERYYEAELYRLKGELLLILADEAEAEASLLKAIEISRSQEAKSWELRSATRLARLLDAQGRREAARQLLGDIYAWFTEGFDTPDLTEARILLEEMN